MDNDRFDVITRAVAQTPSRRNLLRALGGGGVLAGLGVGLSRASSQRGVAAQAGGCTLAFVGTVRFGPSAGQVLDGGTTPGELRGTLSVTPDQSGAITQAQLQLTGGTALPVVGQITGRAINLRLTGAGQQPVIAVGTADQDLATCQGAVDGLMTGPQFGDLGDWHATLSGAGSAIAPAGGQTTGSSAASGGNPPPAMTSIPQPTAATATTPAQPTSASTAAAPPAPTAMTPTGKPTAGLPCKTGQTVCKGACVDLSSDPTNCGSCGNACSANVPCKGGVCSQTQTRVDPCVLQGLTNCNGTCVDITSDANNCGGCTTLCQGGAQCVKGMCQCPNGEPACGGSVCCSMTCCGIACIDTTSDPNNCGSCGNVCPVLPLVGQAPCVAGACVG